MRSLPSRRALLACTAALVAVVTVLAVALAQRPPNPIAVAAAPSSALTTAASPPPTLATTEQTKALWASHRTLYGQGGVEPDSWSLLRFDASVPLVVYDVEAGRLSWSGATHKLTWKPLGKPIVELPIAWADHVRELWNEIRAGSPTVAFTPEEPPTLRNDTTRPNEELTWYRIHLPFEWAATAKPYVLLGNGDGVLLALSVVDATTGQPFVWGHYSTRMMPLGARWDVPLDPEMADPETFMTPRRMNPVRSPRRPDATVGPYHETVTRAVMELDTALSTATLDGDPAPSLGVFARCTAPETHTATGSLVYRLDEEPASRLLAAVPVCPVAFRWAIFTKLNATAGSRSCVSGDAVVRNLAATPPAVLWTKHFDTCRDGPVRQQEPYSVRWQVPPGSDLSALEVRVDATTTVTCVTPSEGLDGAVVSLGETQHAPSFEWPGCWPGWDP